MVRDHQVEYEKTLSGTIRAMLFANTVHYILCLTAMHSLPRAINHCAVQRNLTSETDGLARLSTKLDHGNSHTTKKL